LQNALLHKCKFGQAHSVGLLKRIPMKFSLPFFDISTDPYYFLKFGYLKQMENDFKPGHIVGLKTAQGHSAGAWRPNPHDSLMPKGGPAGRPVDAARHAHQVVTAHGAPTVARPSASSGATRCGGTGEGSSSMKGGKRRARWYRWGRTEAATR
jgi:hypothetical protein